MKDGKKEAAMKHMGEVEEKKPKAEKRHVHKISFERARGGGFTVHKEMRGGKPEEQHENHHTSIASTKDAAHDHLDEAMGDQPDEGEADPNAEPAPPAPDPAAAAGAGAPPMPGAGQ
jgi:hypothetical protein